MDPAYDPQKVEATWYSRWEKGGLLRPEPNAGGTPFCIVIPPPNVTGSLHMGHALDQSIQDVIIRRKRMQGYAALWLPGTDHAGIATQIVVERELAREGLTREELGRERFIEQVWMWKARSGGAITEQIRRMGFATDWSRERFTMDDGLSEAVKKVFVDLYHQDLIYRGKRIINWCPRDRTAISDVEVEHEDELGELVYIRYPFATEPGGIEVATTRAETMLGDTAVAGHPDDPRDPDDGGPSPRSCPRGRPARRQGDADRRGGPGEGRAPRALGGPLRTLPHRGRALPVRAVVRSGRPAGGTRPRGGEGGRHPLHPGTLGED